MSGIAAWLMSGAGNEFLVLDAREGLDATVFDLAARLCPRPGGFGVDGLLAVEKAEGDRVRVGFANADGSAAGYCGNGARCMGRFVHETGITGPVSRLRFPAGEVEAAHEDGDRVEVRQEAPRIVQRGLRLPGDGDTVEADLVEAGVPHLVILTGEPEAFPLDRVGPRLRRADVAGADGANVTVCGLGGGPFVVRTFERGVEGITGACGSGALAAATVLAARGLAGPTVELRPPSGRLLEVRLEEEGRAVLAGDARCRMAGSLPPEALAGW